MADHVRWNSEAGFVEGVIGVIAKKHTRDVDWKGYVHHCTEEDPQYGTKSDRSDHSAPDKGGALDEDPQERLAGRSCQVASDGPAAVG